jgi:hypothetical protein
MKEPFIGRGCRNIPEIEWRPVRTWCSLMAIWADSVLRFIDGMRTAIQAVSQDGTAGVSDQFLDGVATGAIVEIVNSAHSGW